MVTFITKSCLKSLLLQCLGGGLPKSAAPVALQTRCRHQHHLLCVLWARNRQAADPPGMCYGNGHDEQACRLIAICCSPAALCFQADWRSKICDSVQYESSLLTERWGGGCPLPDWCTPLRPSESPAGWRPSSPRSIPCRRTVDAFSTCKGWRVSAGRALHASSE